MSRAGFTIIELIVVMFIITLLGGIVSATIVKSLNDQNKLDAESQVQRELTISLDRVSKALRSTILLLEATETNLKVRAFAKVSDSAPSEINYFIDQSGRWRYSVIPASGTPPNYTYNPADQQTFTLATKITNTSAAPLFNYFDETSAPLTFPVQAADIRLIEITPRGTDSNDLVAPLIFSTKVQLRNFKTNL